MTFDENSSFQQQQQMPLQDGLGLDLHNLKNFLMIDGLPSIFNTLNTKQTTNIVEKVIFIHSQDIPSKISLSNTKMFKCIAMRSCGSFGQH